MKYSFLTLLVFLLPTSALAAPALSTFSIEQALLISSSSPGNLYASGASIVLGAPVKGDFSALGGSIVTTAPVTGDELLIAGSVRSSASVAGDMRVAGGSITVDAPVAGDFAAMGLSINDTARVGGSIFAAAANATLAGGAAGPVTVYGNNVALAGDFAGDVKVVAGSHFSIASGTIIHGKLSYESPESITLSPSVKVVGGATYIHAPYLPDVGTSRTLAYVSIGFFLIARIVGALILAGLLAGLFPKFAEALIERASRARPRTILLTFLLGLGVCVATPIVGVLLLLTFVGIGLAILLFILYALLLLLALMYAGIMVGGFLARRFAKRDVILWHDGVLGTLIFSIAALIPYIGLFIVLLFVLFSIGALLQIFFQFAFPRDTSELI